MNDPRERMSQVLASSMMFQSSRRDMLKRTTLAACAISVLPGVSSPLAAAAQTPSSEPIEDEIVLAMPVEPSTLDPHMIRDNFEWNALNHFYDPLIGRTPDGDTIPGLLTSWEPVNEEQTKWRLTLREGVTFHNGEPWTAEVLKFNFQRLKTNESVTIQQYVNGVDDEEVVDDHTLDISISVPMSLLESGFIQVSIVPMQYLEEMGDAELAANPVGTGPYRFVEWLKDEHIRLEAYEDYWGGLPSVRKGLIRTIPEAPSRVAALVSGEVDVIREVSVYDIERIEQNDSTQVATRPGARVWNLKMDTARATDSPGIEGDNPFVIREVREAVYRAINVEELVNSIFLGNGDPAGQLSAPFIFGHNPDIDRLSYDPERSKQLLAEAGFEDGFTVRFDVDANQAIVGEAIAGYLSDVGITAELNALTTSVYRDLTTSFDTSFTLGGWGGTMVKSTFDANIHSVDPELGYGRANYGQYSNPELDEMIVEANQTFDRDEQEQIFQELQKLSMEDVAVVPLYFEAVIVGASAKLQVVPRFNEWVMLQDITPA